MGDSIRKSFSVDQHFSTQDIIDACKILKKILEKRSEKDSQDNLVEMLMVKNDLLEESISKVTL